MLIKKRCWGKKRPGLDPSPFARLGVGWSAARENFHGTMWEMPFQLPKRPGENELKKMLNVEGEDHHIDPQKRDTKFSKILKNKKRDIQKKTNKPFDPVQYRLLHKGVSAVLLFDTNTNHPRCGADLVLGIAGPLVAAGGRDVAADPWEEKGGDWYTTANGGVGATLAIQFFLLTPGGGHSTF